MTHDINNCTMPDACSIARAQIATPRGDGKPTQLGLLYMELRTLLRVPQVDKTEDASHLLTKTSKKLTSVGCGQMRARQVSRLGYPSAWHHLLQSWTEATDALASNATKVQTRTVRLYANDYSDICVGAYITYSRQFFRSQSDVTNTALWSIWERTYSSDIPTIKEARHSWHRIRNLKLLVDPQFQRICSSWADLEQTYLEPLLSQALTNEAPPFIVFRPMSIMTLKQCLTDLMIYPQDRL